MSNKASTPRFLRGRVISGYGEGRKLGFPTANLKLEPNSFRPPAGVYACWVDYAAHPKSPAILVSGVHWEAPQVPRIEVYLLGFSGDLYGLELDVTVGQKIRDVASGLPTTELKRLIEQDIATVSRLLRG